MALKTGKPPEAGLQTVSRAIQNLATSPDNEMMEMVSEEQRLTAPLQVFSLGLTDLAQDPLNNVEEASWRYVILQGNEPVGAAEINASEEAEFSHFNAGPFVEEMVKAILQAEELDEVNEKDYEARILRIPALYVMALWLHGEDDDFLIPLPPTNENLVAKRKYSPEEFFSNLRDSAQKRLSFDDSPQ